VENTHEIEKEARKAQIIYKVGLQYENFYFAETMSKLENELFAENQRQGQWEIGRMYK
jgi:hypothetical protein